MQIHHHGWSFKIKSVGSERVLSLKGKLGSFTVWSWWFLTSRGQCYLAKKVIVQQSISRIQSHHVQ